MKVLLSNLVTHKVRSLGLWSNFVFTTYGQKNHVQN